jgi:hypothetical protein
MRARRIPKQFLPLQSDAGNIADLRNINLEHWR